MYKISSELLESLLIKRANVPQPIDKTLQQRACG